MSRPNLFDYATSELSQDAFLCWLCKWADNEYSSIDKELNTCAKDFIKNILCKDNNDNLIIQEEIETIDIWRQWNKIDVAVLVNKKYFIIIEDKTNTSHHSNQLTRYKEAAEKYLNKSIYEKIICVYLKTGYQSEASLKSVVDKDYKPVMRKELVEFFQKYSSIQDNIFTDFTSILYEKDKRYTSFETTEVGTWGYNNWVGFYEELETKFSGCAWAEEFVPNGSKPLVFWWNFIKINNIDAYIYLKINQEKLAIKLSVANERENIREQVKNVINKKSQEYKYKDLHLSQHNIRMVKNDLTVGYSKNSDWLGIGKLDMDKVVTTLKQYMEFIDDCANKNI